MERKLYLMVAAVLMLSVSINAYAQSSDEESRYVPNRFHFGIRGGSSLSVGEVGTFAFVQGGLGLDYQIAQIPLFFESGLQYMNKGQFDWDSSIDENHVFYVPLLLSYHINIGPNLFLQPFAGLTAGFSGTRLFFDSAARIGIGFNFGRLYTNMGIDIGLTSHKTEVTQPTYYTKNWTNYNLFATVGVNFVGSR